MQSGCAGQSGIMDNLKYGPAIGSLQSDMMGAKSTLNSMLNNSNNYDQKPVSFKQKIH